ncbi:MAG: polyprenyl synthetase family protein [Deltaproteobacteria bacterium]|nr:MAG: polyprenyl synthetase family protein [Deltaproteobacteria bacterium]
MDVQAYLAERGSWVERQLDASVPAASEPPQALHAAMRHLLFPGGKRLRPVLALAAGEAVGAPSERVLAFAGAVELVHTYSLIHDDLPCMDDDAERRGRPSVHVAFGQATAVLAGDALLAAAFETLASDAAGLPADAVLAALRELAAAAGSRNLVGGQVDDLAFEPAGADAPYIESIHARKTGALITAAVVGGGRLGGADAGTLAGFRRFGEALGVAFQIRDDLLDAAEQGRCSLLRAVDPVRAEARADELLEHALRTLEALDERAEPLRELARYAVRRDR